MPGGPIDPNRVISLIKAGAPYRDEGIVLGGTRKRLVPENGIWQTANDGHHLSAETYNVLLNSSPTGNVFVFNGVTYQLAPVLSNGVSWAVHQQV